MLDNNTPDLSLELGIFRTILGAADAMIFRCANDDEYTMDYIAGNPRGLSGYGEEDLLGNATVSWVGLTHKADIDRVVTAVDSAIEEDRPWDVSYRIIQRDGSPAWVRERGIAVHEGEELKYLQGLIVSAAEERRQFKRAEQVLVQSQDANSQIMDLAGKIATSVQTLSILSINARIEAARSGEAGRGFAIVADEISTLADQNGEWANEITAKMKAAEGGARLAE